MIPYARKGEWSKREEAKKNEEGEGGGISVDRTRESFLIRGNLLLPDFQRRISNLSLSLLLGSIF